MIAIAALDAGGAHASGDLRSDPGGFTGRLTLANGTLGGTLDFAPVGEAQRIDAHLTANERKLPRRLRGSQRPRRRHDHPRRRAHHDRRRGRCARHRSERDHARPAHRQCQAGQRLGPGPRGLRRPPRRRLRFLDAGRRHARHDPADRQRADRAPAAGAQPGGGADPLGRRLGAGADQPQLRRRDRDRRPAAAARGPRSMRRSRRMPLEVLDLAWPNLDLSGSATGRLDYAWKGNRNGRLDLKVRGLSRAGLVLASKPIDVGIAAVVERQSGRAARGRGERRRGRRPRPGAVRADGRRPAGRRADERALVRAASLRRAGRHLVAADGKRGDRHVGPARGRRRHRRPARRPGRSAARSRPRTRGSKARSPAWSSTSVASQARFSGPQLIFSQISGQTAGRRLGHAAAARSPSPAARPRSTCRSTPTRRCCSTATMSPRGSPGRCRSVPTGKAGTISGDLKLNKGRFQLGRASAAAAVPQLQVRDTRARPGGRDRGRRTFIRGSSTSSSPEATSR